MVCLYERRAAQSLDESVVMLGWPTKPSIRSFSFPLALLVAANTVGCDVPDDPAAHLGEPGAALIEFLRPDSTRSLRVGDGVFYSYLWSPQGPWAVHIATLDLDRCDVGFEVVAAEGERGRRLRAPVSDATPAAQVPVVGVNGDFFTEAGSPVGTEVSATTFLVFRGRPAVAFVQGQDPWIGMPEPTGDGVRLGPFVARPGGSPSGVQAISGFPELLSQGEIVGDLEVSTRVGFAAARHPRTAFGFNPETKKGWLVVVDGRQSPHSVGMSLPELADLFLALGASEAINLDGGGSSSMVVRGRVMNRPSDATGERPVANSLWIYDSFRCTTPGAPTVGRRLD